MSRHYATFTPTLIAVALWAAIGAATAADEQATGKELVLAPNNVKWMSCGVAKFPGCEAALLHGDPGKGPYSMYVRLPTGAEFEPHWHSNDHYLLGVEGTLTFRYKDGSIVSLSPGTFAHWPGKEMMMGRCTSKEACVYYDHQNTLGDVHFPTAKND